MKLEDSEMEMEMEMETKLMRYLRQPFLVLIVIDPNQLLILESFKYFGSI
jgi:hypothetical protein